jgi:hypothetical protein
MPPVRHRASARALVFVGSVAGLPVDPQRLLPSPHRHSVAAAPFVVFQTFLPCSLALFPALIAKAVATTLKVLPQAVQCLKAFCQIVQLPALIAKAPVTVLKSFLQAVRWVGAFCQKRLITRTSSEDPCNCLKSFLQAVRCLKASR